MIKAKDLFYSLKLVLDIDSEYAPLFEAGEGKGLAIPMTGLTHIQKAIWTRYVKNESILPPGQVPAIEKEKLWRAKYNPLDKDVAPGRYIFTLLSPPLQGFDGATNLVNILEKNMLSTATARPVYDVGMTISIDTSELSQEQRDLIIQAFIMHELAFLALNGSEIENAVCNMSDTWNDTPKKDRAIVQSKNAVHLKIINNTLNVGVILTAITMFCGLIAYAINNETIELVERISTMKESITSFLAYVLADADHYPFGMHTDYANKLQDQEILANKEMDLHLPDMSKVAHRDFEPVMQAYRQEIVDGVDANIAWSNAVEQVLVPMVI